MTWISTQHFHGFQLKTLFTGSQAKMKNKMRTSICRVKVRDLTQLHASCCYPNISSKSILKTLTQSDPPHIPSESRPQFIRSCRSTCADHPGRNQLGSMSWGCSSLFVVSSGESTPSHSSFIAFVFFWSPQEVILCFVLFFSYFFHVQCLVSPSGDEKPIYEFQEHLENTSYFPFNAVHCFVLLRMIRFICQ